MKMEGMSETVNLFDCLVRANTILFHYTTPDGRDEMVKFPLAGFCENYLMQFAHKVSGKYRGVAKLEGNTKAKVLQVLATFAYADYCRSAATPGARCRDCHGTGRAVDIAKTEQWGRVVEKECGRCKGVGYSRMPASAAYRAVTMLIPNLTQPTWSRTVKPLYDALVVQCHKEESIADNILNAVTR